MKPKFFRWIYICMALALVFGILTACARATPPVVAEMELPIELVFTTPDGENALLLGGDIVYLGSAAMGSVYAGAREENASLVVLRWAGQDHFFSLKGFDVNTLQKIVCKVDCDIIVSIIEGEDIFTEVKSININKPLAEPKVIWEKTVDEKPAASTGKCDYLLFKKGGSAEVVLPLKMRSSPEIPQNFNSNVISYMQAGEIVEVIADTQEAWVNIRKTNGETGWSKQCSTINGRFMNPK